MKQPKMILLTGFLGAGKTTLMLELINTIKAKNQKCAVIINEVGEIGIDNQLMRIYQTDVYDLFGGCVCCTLKVTLQATLLHLLEDPSYNDLDYILFEPSGMAEPYRMLEAIQDSGIRDLHTIFICDPTRLSLYRVRLAGLFHAYLKTADMVIINKQDYVSADDLQEIRQMTCEKYIIEKNTITEIINKIGG